MEGSQFLHKSRWAADSCPSIANQLIALVTNELLKQKCFVIFNLCDYSLGA